MMRGIHDGHSRLVERRQQRALQFTASYTAFSFTSRSIPRDIMLRHFIYASSLEIT